MAARCSPQSYPECLCLRLSSTELRNLQIWCPPHHHVSVREHEMSLKKSPVAYIRTVWLRERPDKSNTKHVDKTDTELQVYSNFFYAERRCDYKYMAIWESGLGETVRFPWNAKYLLDVCWNRKKKKKSTYIFIFELFISLSGLSSI